MIRFSVLLAVVGSLVFLWHECGQDTGIFCYRIGRDAVSGLRTRGLVPESSRASHHFPVARKSSECLSPSVISSTRFLTPTDSVN